MRSHFEWLGEQSHLGFTRIYSGRWSTRWSCTTGTPSTVSPASAAKGSSSTGWRENAVHGQPRHSYAPEKLSVSPAPAAEGSGWREERGVASATPPIRWPATGEPPCRASAARDRGPPGRRKAPRTPPPRTPIPAWRRVLRGCGQTGQQQRRAAYRPPQGREGRRADGACWRRWGDRSGAGVPRVALTGMCSDRRAAVMYCLAGW